MPQSDQKRQNSVAAGIRLLQVQPDTLRILIHMDPLCPCYFERHCRLRLCERFPAKVNSSYGLARPWENINGGRRTHL
jgi:hypothetical protein